MIGGAKTPVTRPVDLGLPSGTKWAPKNVLVGSADGFTDNALSSECSYFSFGNPDGHDANSNNSFLPWTWGSSVDGEPYASSVGASIAYPDTIPANLDAAQVHCGLRWFIPSSDDWAELFENTDLIDASGDIIPDENQNKLITYMGVKCLRLRSRLNRNELLLPCNGIGDGDVLSSKGTVGWYSSATLRNANNSDTVNFSGNYFNPSRTRPRYVGMPIRPVWRDD